MGEGNAESSLTGGYCVVFERENARFWAKGRRAKIVLTFCFGYDIIAKLSHETKDLNDSHFEKKFKKLEKSC